MTPRTDAHHDRLDLGGRLGATAGEAESWPSVMTLPDPADAVLDCPNRPGASDGGQGNGVWSHMHLRTDPYVTGYLAPRFPDQVCPPTADPNDPRGGKPVTAWRWSPTLNPPPFPGRDKFVLGATNDYALQLQTWLQRGNWGPPYRVGPSRTMTALDLEKVAALQQHYLADLGPADGLTGPKTWLYAWQVAGGLRSK